MREQGPQLDGNRRWKAKRVPMPADEMVPLVRQIAHDELMGRPNTDRTAQEQGARRADIQDAWTFELHRRVERLEQMHGLTSNALPGYRGRRAA